MLHNMYVIYDVKAEVYNKPVFMMNHNVAIRAASDVLKDPNSEIAKHPEDFTMFYIGTYEDTTAAFDFEPAPMPLVKFIELAGGEQNG